MPDLLSRITIDSNICHGQPTVRGLRYTVQSVLELLASGMSNEEILADYPDLEANDLRACQAYAASLLQRRQPPLLSMNGKTDEEWNAGRISGPLTKQEFLAHLIKIGKLPPDTKLK
ncbi:DUF433 domain-containing protein [Hymenobacter weizhouensis]|uniref:DUF433 domain-containing protein n=1 Tax=Hymenobacter sp. YIM 151500-1 TaxID=2987689 RepID=UPI0029D40E0C|nr:DUF433 domain-containing protein [Hymenobacter sp. YIM 151500-1]